LEVRIDLNGLPVTFLDTAGLRESDDVIERIGVARARSRASGADLRILLIDGLQAQGDFDPGIAVDLRYMTKSDVTGSGISAVSGEGIDQLLADVSRILMDRVSGATLASHERHRQALERAHALMMVARSCFIEGRVGAEILALHLRDAVGALDSLIGRVDVEAVLCAIFAQFCIGK
jgi:Predicted GTPase